jgi:hypothetical protein
LNAIRHQPSEQKLLTFELFLTRSLGSTMLRSDEPIRPMTLGNMCSLGVRRLFAKCGTCAHEAEVGLPLLSFPIRS